MKVRKRFSQAYLVIPLVLIFLFNTISVFSAPVAIFPTEVEDNIVPTLRSNPILDASIGEVIRDDTLLLYVIGEIDRFLTDIEELSALGISSEGVYKRFEDFKKGIIEPLMGDKGYTLSDGNGFDYMNMRIEAGTILIPYLVSGEVVSFYEITPSGSRPEYADDIFNYGKVCVYRQDPHHAALRFVDSLIGRDSKGELMGYKASGMHVENYNRVFSRDSIILGLAAALSGKLDGFLMSLETLAKNQSEREIPEKNVGEGAIPSNVAADGHISYGASPRVDASILFVVGCGQYHKHISDAGEKEKFIGRFLPHIENTIAYLEKYWVKDDTGLLFIPTAGDWADEYLQEGFVLFDEVLWYMALNEYAYILDSTGKSKEAEAYREKAGKVKEIIRDKFWVKDEDKGIDSTYSNIVKKHGDVGYFRHFFVGHEETRGKVSSVPDSSFEHPHGIFDAFGNVLAILSGIATDEQAEDIIDFISKVVHPDYNVPPSHYPVFPEVVFKALKNYQYRFKEKEGHFHNGGIWTLIGGFYAAALVKSGKAGMAEDVYNDIRRANMQLRNGLPFSEYHVYNPDVPTETGGVPLLGFSVAGQEIAWNAVRKRKIIFNDIALPREKVPGTSASGKEDIPEEPETREFKDSVIERTFENNRAAEKEHIILALGTDWTKTSGTASEGWVNGLLSAVRRYCDNVGGITFVYSGDKDLSGQIETARSSLGGVRVKVVAVALKESVFSESYEGLRSDPDAFVVGVDNSNIGAGEVSYRYIVDVLTMALRLDEGRNYTFYADIIEKTSDGKFPDVPVLVLPKTEPLDLEEVRDKYRLQVRILELSA